MKGRLLLWGIAFMGSNSHKEPAAAGSSGQGSRPGKHRRRGLVRLPSDWDDSSLRWFSKHAGLGWDLAHLPDSYHWRNGCSKTCEQNNNYIKQISMLQNSPAHRSMKAKTQTTHILQQKAIFILYSNKQRQLSVQAVQEGTRLLCSLGS